VSDVFAAGTLSTMQVKELCRRQLLARTSAASEKCTVAGIKLLSSSAISTAVPASPSFVAVASPQASPATIAASPSSAGVQQRSPSFNADEQVRRPVVESLQSVDTVSTTPSLIWHVPAASCVNSVSDVGVIRSPRPPSNSADSADGSSNQQFAVVSLIDVHRCFGLFYFENLLCQYCCHNCKELVLEFMLLLREST